MKRVLILIAALSLGACATPRPGTAFDVEAHTVPGSDAGRIIVYPNTELDDAIWFMVEANSERAPRLFQNTFVAIDAEAGPVTVRLTEYWTGKGLGKELGKVFTELFAPPDPHPWPETLNPHARTLLDVDVVAGASTYIRVTKDRKETIEPCAESQDTLTICERTIFDTRLTAVPAGIAISELMALQENTK